MHELLLFAQVPTSQHPLLLQQLAGYTRMQPKRKYERHLILKARRPPGLGKMPSGGSQDVQALEIQKVNSMLNGGLFYMQLVGEVKEASFGNVNSKQSAPPLASQPLTGKGGPEVIHQSLNSRQGNGTTQVPEIDWKYDETAQTWSLEFRDLPEAGTRNTVTSRLMASIKLSEGNPLEFTKRLGYEYVSEYLVDGHEFVEGDIRVFLHRVLHCSVTEEEVSSPRKELPAYSDFSPLDTSGGYVLQVSISVQDGNNQATMKTAINLLLGFKEAMKSVVKLEPGDRLALDTRVKDPVRNV